VRAYLAERDAADAVGAAQPQTSDLS